jgi:hydrogenase/urease accessory protein HupE
MNRWLITIVVGILLSASTAWGHGSSLAVFKVSQQSSSSYDILWKVNRAAAAATINDLQFPESCSFDGEPERLTREGITRTRAHLLCKSEVGLGMVKFPTDPPGLHVMIEASFLEGESLTLLLREEREAQIAPSAALGLWAMVQDYIFIGVEHILLGPDHLLFVLGLLLITVSARKLIYAVTAFTIAHSITLALAVLGVLTLRSEPVEACIALSIVLLAYEVLTDSETLSKRLPWLVAFGFGLLHGLGFAGALQEVGLPDSQLPIALVSFNVGVEAGQLLFVWVVWQCTQWIRVRNEAWGRNIRTCTAYGMGTVAVYWVIERVGLVLSLA